MATRTFADLSPYRRAVSNAQGTANLLDTILGGIQQGVQLQRLPQTLQSQDIAQQLQNAINQQKLLDIQNPQAALARDIERELTVKGALNPNLGLINLERGLGTIGTPGAITAAQQASFPSAETLAMREIALNQAGVPSAEFVVPRAQAGIPVTEVAPFGISTGVYSDPNVPRQAAEDKLERDISLANSRVRSAGVQGQFIPDGFGGMVFAQRPTTQGGEVVTSRVNTPEGEAVKVPPKTSVSGSRGLTPNAQTTLLGQATAAGVDVDSPKYFDQSTGAYNFTQIAIDKGKAQRENKRLENEAKASGLSGKTKTEIDALNAAERQLSSLQDEISEIANSGQTPGFLDDFVSASTASGPTGGLSFLYQRMLKGLQGEEAKVLEGKKSIISSALVKAISGLAVTLSEEKRLQFLPRPGDSFQDLVRKTSLVQDYIENQRAGLSGETAPAAPTTPPAGSGTTIGRFRLIGTR